MTDQIPSGKNSLDQSAGRASRRKLLKVGAAGVPAIISMKGGAALAETVASLAGCDITIDGDVITDPLATDQKLEQHVLTAEEVVKLLANEPYKDIDTDNEYRAYFESLEKLHNDGVAGAGYSCITSVMMAASSTQSS